MSKEEKPLEYPKRIADTKGTAQRIDFEYLNRPSRFQRYRFWITISAVVASVAGITPFFFKGDAFSSGPVSRAHAIFENKCAQCHTQRFSTVSDASCKKCHDGPPHPAKQVDRGARLISAPACAQCHVEHRGRVQLTTVSDRNCTACHSNLNRHGIGVRIRDVNITAFRPGRHPEFSPAFETDLRPLRLNHAIHMPAKPKVVRGMKLPMKCSDCHVTDTASPKGDLLPVTFQQNCRSCHKRELEFDVYQLLGPKSVPAPHTKNPATIHAFIMETYQRALEQNPRILDRPLGRDLDPTKNPQVWLARVVKDSESFLFDRKCTYCHQYSGIVNSYPVVKKVNEIRGRYVETIFRGEPWFQRGEFSHRAHRAVQCVSCHTRALKSTKTSDVLIPRIGNCLPCHGSGNAVIGSCSECHLYHNKSKETDKDRRPIEQLITECFYWRGP